MHASKRPSAGCVPGHLPGQRWNRLSWIEPFYLAEILVNQTINCRDWDAAIELQRYHFDD
ncbi:hypothetical protein K239x_06880 [Planctomycetes bacterium K23_9]|uniref:Uncharacterized protein n=1 Tax=Stieleria marina TaxID=1930275 RepID=A0A517NNP4_9BACT|nr:hypothetical protein K239x_06880 [Planctomycetes bacterium K23_9]